MGEFANITDFGDYDTLFCLPSLGAWASAQCHKAKENLSCPSIVSL